MIPDLRYAARMLARSPLLASAIVLTLALGIGLNTAVFSVLNGMLFRGRVEKDPETFVHLAPEYVGREPARALPGAISVADYRAYRARTRTLDPVAAWTVVHATLGRENPAPVLALAVTCDFFHLYGLDQPAMGRFFRPEECSTPGDAPVVVLSEEIWRDRLGSDPQVLGSVVVLNRRAFTVTGIVPARFSGRLRGPGIWIPYTMQAPFFGGRDLFQDEHAPWLVVEGRLRPGATRAAAAAELAVIARQQDALDSGRRTTMILTNGSLAEEPSLRARLIWIGPLIMAGLTLLLLLACTNVTMLLLSRAAARQREIAIRLSLGAGRRQLLRMLLMESLVLASLAGAASAALAHQMPGVFTKLFASAPYYPVKADAIVFAYLAGVTLLAGCLAGLAPAAESLKVDLWASLKGDAGLITRGRPRSRGFLISSQVALSTVLLVAAATFMRAQFTMFTADPGFETRQVMLVPLPIDVPPYNIDSAAGFDREAARRIRAIPGVQALSFAAESPVSGDEGPSALEALRPGQVKGSGQPVAVNAVSAGYFETLGIPILHGRTFREGEVAAGGAVPAIVSEAFARALWPARDPLGQVFEAGGWFQVAGVARDTSAGRFGAADIPLFYRLRRPDQYGDSLLVRFQGDAAPLADAIRRSIRDMDREMAPVPQTLQAVLDEASSRFWKLTSMVLTLGAAAVLLAIVGIYGVAALAVNRRMREMGVRVALGATRRQIVTSVMASGLRPIAAGLLVGMLLAALGSRAMAHVLSGMGLPLRAGDPLAFAAVALLLASAAGAAMLGPALRASAADPTWALRQE